MKFLTTIFLLPTICFGQVEWDYSTAKEQVLVPLTFDTTTESTIIYLKKEARIFLRQRDVIDHLMKKLKGDFSNTNTINGLGTEKKIIVVDNYFEEKVVNQNKEENQINILMEYVSADLILEGKFMLTAINNGKIINKGLKTKKREENGNKYFDFLLPDKKPFLTMVLSYKSITFR